MHVEYEYDVNNLVHRVTNYRYVSGQPVQTSAVEYEYDIANRVTSISHLDAVDGLIRSLNYTYTDNSEPETITEDTAGQTGVATTTFTYDDRGRLIREIRTGLTGEGAYDFEYQYDQGGNRTVKIGGPATMPAGP